MFYCLLLCGFAGVLMCIWMLGFGEVVFVCVCVCVRACVCVCKWFLGGFWFGGEREWGLEGEAKFGFHCLFGLAVGWVGGVVLRYCCDGWLV